MNENEARAKLERLRELQTAYFLHSDEGGDYLSAQQMDELLNLQRERLQALEEALYKLSSGDHVGTSINSGSAAMQLIDAALDGATEEELGDF